MNDQIGSFIIVIYVVGWITTATLYENEDEYNRWVIWLICTAWPFILIKRLMK